MRAHALAIWLIFAPLSVATRAHAQTAPGAAVTGPALALKLELGQSQLDAESVRKAIELELKRPVVLEAAVADAPSLSVVAHADHTVTLSYRTSTGLIRTRSIGIPENGARGAEVIALLSGNLSRDEAADLLAELSAKASPPEVKPAAPPLTSAVSEPIDPKPAATADTLPKPSPVETRPPPSPKRAPESSQPQLLATPFPAINLSLIPPLTLYRNSEQRIFALELGLGYSHVGALHGAGLNWFVLRTERELDGMSFATIYNDTGGKVTGASGSGFVNRRQQLRGVELSGLVNIGTGDGQGFAAAGWLNLAQDFEGLQAAGLVNWSAAFQGLQAATLLNRAGSVTGVQASGVVNVAGSVSGLQLGVVNVAGDVHGLQLGVVNVARHVKGSAIGLVSVADNGRVQPVLWASSSVPLNAAAKFTVGPLYTQVGLGFAPANQTYSYELGLGGHFPIGRCFLEPGVHYSELRSTKHPFDAELIEYGHYRLAAGLPLGKVSPFAGVGVAQRFAHRAEAPASKPLTFEVFGGAAFF